MPDEKRTMTAIERDIAECDRKIQKEQTLTAQLMKQFGKGRSA